jgi:hypothetical protein
MWSEEIREAYRLFVALVESNLTKLLEAVEEYIAEYYAYILIGSTILIIGVILDLLWKRQENKKKNRIDQEIAEQMKEKVMRGMDDKKDADQ